MKNKDFIMDNNIIRWCNSNIAKMNIFEYIYYYLFIWRASIKDIKYTFLNIFELLLQGLEGICLLIVNIIIIIFYPVSLMITGLLRIKEAKREVERSKRWE